MARRFPSPTPKQSARLEQEIERLVEEHDARMNVPAPQQPQAAQREQEYTIER